MRLFQGIGSFMKKLDKLLITSFLGPFFITFFVVVFILLTVFMLKYFDEIIGKGLGYGIIAQLIFYFSINMTTNALPLAVLLSSLMTFGNLGVHFELTAIKSSGVSLPRILQPLFLITCIIVVLGFYNNNFLVPKANLEAFSLLYDIKQKKPALDIKQGVFYSSIPGYSIKINERMPDGETLKDIIIYEHLGQRGNKDVILADSGKMYNILNNRYLVLELFNGKSYSEQQPPRNRRFKSSEIAKPYLRSTFEKNKIVFNLSEFDLKRTQKELFNSNRLMKNINQLRSDLDSMTNEYSREIVQIRLNTFQFFTYHMKDIIDLRTGEDSANVGNHEKQMNWDGDELMIDEPEISIDSNLNKGLGDTAALTQEKIILDSSRSISINLIDSAKKARLKSTQITSSKNTNAIRKIGVKPSGVEKNKAFSTPTSRSLKNTDKYVPKPREEIADSLKDHRTSEEKIDSLLQTPIINRSGLAKALNHVRYVKGNMTTQMNQLDDMIKQIRKFEIERYKKLAMSLTILAMFLVGAPLGAIVKKGGLGMPVLLSISFFVLFYVISMLGEKWARQGLVSPLFGVWLANMILFPIGFVFLNQARKDAKLFDGDFYQMWFEKFKKKISGMPK